MKRKPFLYLIQRIVKFCVRKDKAEWRTAMPDTPAFFVANHTRLYAPLSLLYNLTPKTRPWVNGFLCETRTGIEHFHKRILKNRRFKLLTYPLSVLLMPMITWFFKGLNPIKVFRGVNVIKTFNDSVKALENGESQSVFPEINFEYANEYVNSFQRGFVCVAQHYYNKTKKLLPFYPVYVAPKLNKILVGEPIVYNPDIPVKQQCIDICAYLENAIKELGDSIPPHKIVRMERRVSPEQRAKLIAKMGIEDRYRKR